MIVGHYAAALIPCSRLKGQPFWLLLLCAQIPEFLWLALALAGVESPTPASLMEATFQNIRVHMTYSHNLVPAILQAGVVTVVVNLCFRNRELAGWCGFLTLFHVLCDLVVGFEHQLLGAKSAQVALNTYGQAPYLAITIELIFSLACIRWYQYSEMKRGRPIPPGRLLALYAIFIVGVSLWFPTATLSLKEQLQYFG